MDRIHSGFTDDNVASRLASFDGIVSDNETNKLVNHAFVTELTAYHLMGRYQKQYILDILYQMETSESVSELEQLKDQMKDYLRKTQNELINYRDSLFVIYNKGTGDVYGALADNIQIRDRDLYIKELVCYYEIIKNLKNICLEGTTWSYSLKDDSDESFYNMQDIAMIFLDDAFPVNSARLCHSCSLYGDLSAVNNLMHGVSSEVPDLTFNCGETLTD